MKINVAKSKVIHVRKKIVIHECWASVELIYLQSRELVASSTVL